MAADAGPFLTRLASSHNVGLPLDVLQLGQPYIQASVGRVWSREGSEQHRSELSFQTQEPRQCRRVGGCFGEFAVFEVPMVAILLQ